MVKIEIFNSDYKDFIKTVESNTIDSVLIDPPYGVLGNHTIETKVDIKYLTSEVNRILKDKTFYAIFGQQPHIKKWMDPTDEIFNFKQEVIWCKRDCSVSASDLTRLHENIMIYQKGIQKFYETQGNYEDVSQPMTMDGLMNVESIFRELSYLKGLLNDKELNNTHDKTKSTYVNSENGNKFRTLTSKNKNTKKFNKDTKNFSSIWSFLPHNKKHRNPIEGQIDHPTVKSIELMERLIELTTPIGGTVVDLFLGSGTTAIACINTNRNFIGCEIHEDYYNIAKARVDKKLKEFDNVLF